MNINPTLIALVIAGCLGCAVWLGTRIRRRLPESHLGSDTKDAVKMAVGLIATMSALVLGLLVSSAKDSYDTASGEVIQMAAKVTFLDRVLNLYGPEAAPVRSQFHAAAAEVARQMWAEDNNAASEAKAGDALYAAIQNLSPQNDTQRALKEHAATLAVELAALRTLLRVQSLSSFSPALLIGVVFWLVIIFFSFSLLSPPNATATSAAMISAISVAAAFFLILEMDRPFSGVIQISNAPIVNALGPAAR